MVHGRIKSHANKFQGIFFSFFGVLFFMLQNTFGGLIKCDINGVKKSPLETQKKEKKIQKKHNL